MRKVAHEVFAAGTAILFLNPSIAHAPMVLLGAITGGIFPDIDVKLKHRKLMHNIFSLLITSFALFYIMRFILSPLNMLEIFIQAFLIGYFTHILLDLFTVRGVAILWPILARSFRFSERKYDDPLLNALFIVLGLMAMISYVVFMYK